MARQTLKSPTQVPAIDTEPEPTTAFRERARRAARSHFVTHVQHRPRVPAPLVAATEPAPGLPGCPTTTSHTCPESGVEWDPPSAPTPVLPSSSHTHPLVHSPLKEVEEALWTAIQVLPEGTRQNIRRLTHAWKAAQATFQQPGASASASLPLVSDVGLLWTRLQTARTDRRLRLALWRKWASVVRELHGWPTPEPPVKTGNTCPVQVVPPSVQLLSDENAGIDDADIYACPDTRARERMAAVRMDLGLSPLDSDGLPPIEPVIELEGAEPDAEEPESSWHLLQSGADAEGFDSSIDALFLSDDGEPPSDAPGPDEITLSPSVRAPLSAPEPDDDDLTAAEVTQEFPLPSLENLLPPLSNPTRSNPTLFDPIPAWMVPGSGVRARHSGLFATLLGA